MIGSMEDPSNDVNVGSRPDKLRNMETDEFEENED